MALERPSPVSSGRWGGNVFTNARCPELAGSANFRNFRAMQPDWAGWRRSWHSYDVNMKEWPAWRDAHCMRHISEGDALFEGYWRAIFDDTHAGLIDTWDYQRLFTMWQHDGLSIFPRNTMVANLGFGADATHTRRLAPAWLSEATITEPTFPLVHPMEVKTVPGFDRHFGRKLFGISRAGITKRLVTRNAVARQIRHWLTTS